MGDKKIIVNSWNEWDPLKHVIVGRADGTCIPGPEPALEAKVPEDSDMRGKFGTRGKDTIDKANQLLDDFSNIVQENPLIGGSVYFEVAKSAVNNLATATQDISNLTQAFFFALTR